MPFFQKFHYFLISYLGFLSVLNIFCKFLTNTLRSLSILLVFLESHLQAPLENDSFNWRLSLFWQEYLVLNTLSQHIQHHVNQSHHLQQKVLWPLGFMTRLLTFITLLCSSTISPPQSLSSQSFSFLLCFRKLNRYEQSICISNMTSNSPTVAMSVWVNMNQLLWWLTSNSIYKERDALPGGVGIALL